MKKAFKTIEMFFDLLEDIIRERLSKHPFIYGFIGGSGVILFWRGVWYCADWLEQNTIWGSVIFSNIGSMIFGVVVLLMSGLFVSIFIGESIIISGIKHEKKVTEKTEEEVIMEEKGIETIEKHLDEINEKLEIVRKMTRK